jgi:hypothetical protein
MARQDRLSFCPFDSPQGSVGTRSLGSGSASDILFKIRFFFTDIFLVQGGKERSSCDTPLTATLPDLNTLTVDALKALMVAQHERLLTREREVEHLKLLIARFQRMKFGRKSEKLAQQKEQPELRLEELQSEPSEDSSPEPDPSVLTNKDNKAGQ